MTWTTQNPKVHLDSYKQCSWNKANTSTIPPLPWMMNKGKWHHNTLVSKTQNNLSPAPGSNDFRFQRSIRASLPNDPEVQLWTASVFSFEDNGPWRWSTWMIQIYICNIDSQEAMNFGAYWITEGVVILSSRERYSLQALVAHNWQWFKFGKEFHLFSIQNNMQLVL